MMCARMSSTGICFDARILLKRSSMPAVAFSRAFALALFFFSKKIPPKPGNPPRNRFSPLYPGIYPNSLNKF